MIGFPLVGKHFVCSSVECVLSCVVEITRPIFAGDLFLRPVLEDVLALERPSEILAKNQVHSHEVWQACVEYPFVHSYRDVGKTRHCQPTSSTFRPEARSRLFFGMSMCGIARPIACAEKLWSLVFLLRRRAVSVLKLCEDCTIDFLCCFAQPHSDEERAWRLLILLEFLYELCSSSLLSLLSLLLSSSSSK